MNTSFIIKPYDPIDEAIQLFQDFNQKPEDRQHTEAELTQLVVYRIKRYYQEPPAAASQEPLTLGRLADPA